MNGQDAQLFFAFPARRTFFDGRLLRQLRFVWPAKHRRPAVQQAQVPLFDDADWGTEREESSAR
jgi:hypothetical protein